MKTSLTHYYMDIAKRTAQLSHCKRRQVGAILVSADESSIISYGYNGTPFGYDNCCEDSHNNTLPIVIHAEINAITKAARLGHITEDAFLFVTLSPCINCALAIAQSGIKQVYYHEKYKCTEGILLLANSNVQITQTNY